MCVQTAELKGAQPFVEGLGRLPGGGGRSFPLNRKYMFDSTKSEEGAFRAHKLETQGGVTTKQRMTQRMVKQRTRARQQSVCHTQKPGPPAGMRTGKVPSRGLTRLLPLWSRAGHTFHKGPDSQCLRLQEPLPPAAEAHAHC